MTSPHSPDEWITLCKQRLNAALALKNASQPNATWEQCGFAIEACLKAAIMRKEGMNRWPAPHEEQLLWTHDLTYLSSRLGVDFRTFDPRDPAAAAWKMALEWQRGHGYSVERLPMRHAAQMYEAAFGSNGVVEWLAKRFQLNI